MLTVQQLIVLSLLYLNAHAWPKVQVKFQNVTYSYTQGCGYVNATVSPDGYLSVLVKPSIDVEQVLLTGLVKFATDDSANYNIVFMNKTDVDLCKFSQNPRYEPLIQLFYKIVAEKFNVPQRCPIKKTELFSTTNYIFETDRLPPILTSKYVFLYVKYSQQKDRKISKLFDITLIGLVKYVN